MTTPTEPELLSLLRAVIDPELGGNVVDLGMATVTGITPEGIVNVGFKLTIRGCPLRQQLKNDIESRVGTTLG